ncbi:GntR family transcriptional regulator [Ramlibacter sp. G-1-2-2]|uniref:GntR family transcriptional regulator n=1 Tax=Ramlibacter agri TaxID=2728837 RepID=A0A848HJE7_9BURK|nr:GntR family transcriptional regulator [Ramlibacter agri]NML47868.1 GntR family transcriptional regulator [Ramlibacter agri]
MPSPSLVEAAALSLPELVYRELRNAILNGVFAPGQMLRQEEVAAKMGVSRGPLREALPRLEAEGLVVLQPRKGYAVAELDPEQIREVFDLRIKLETDIAARAIKRRTPDDIAKVRQLVEQMHQTSAQRTDSEALADWFELNANFHRAMLDPAGMPHHMRAVETARGIIEIYVRAELRLTGALNLAQDEHAELAQAFVDGDEKKFVALTREHSQHSRDRLLARFRKQSPTQLAASAAR